MAFDRAGIPFVDKHAAFVQNHPQLGLLVRHGIALGLVLTVVTLAAEILALPVFWPLALLLLAFFFASEQIL